MTVEVHLRKRFQCSVCNRSWSSRRTAERHAADCIHDPATMACPTCKHDHWPGGYDESPPGCNLGLRPDDVSCIRRCDRWEPSREAERLCRTPDLASQPPPVSRGGVSGGRGTPSSRRVGPERSTSPGPPYAG